MLTWLDDDIQRVADLKAALSSIRGRVDAHPLPDDYAYGYGGVPELRVEIIESLRSDQYLFIPLTGLIFLIVLAYLFRRPSGMVLPLAIVFMAVVSTVAVMVWTGSAINIVNNVLPLLIFIIGIADSVHLLTRQAEEIQAGATPIEAIKAMIEHTGFACLMTSTTTAVGFVSLFTANTRILQNFAWQAAVGVMFAYMFTLFLLPAALSYMRPVERRADRQTDDPEEAPLLERWILEAAEWILDRPVPVIVAGLIFCGGAGYLASKVEVNTTLLEVFHRDHPSYESTKMIEEKFGGFLPMEVSLESSTSGRFKDPTLYRKLHELQTSVARYEPVLSTQSLVDFHQSARAALLNQPEARSEMPTSRAQIQQLHLLVAGSPDASNGPNQFVTQDFSQVRLLLRVRDVGAKRQLRLAEQVREDLRRIFGETSDVSWTITGDAYVASAALESFIYDLLYSLLFAGVIIFLLMTFMFRSVQIGLLSMIPNALPLIITFGYMGLQGINLNSTTVIIFAIGLGLAVDDTIHVLARFREERDTHDSIREAILDTYFGAGRAIVLTSILLIAGMSVVLWSDFIPTRQFGTLITITVFGAILGDLILLPPVLYLIFRDKDDTEG
jgi:hydrophobe/amphiphile efflux-3 (HAE3) family protein